MKKFRVIFMGTPDFVVPALSDLSNAAEVVCVVTQPDKPRGRGHKLQSPPVKIFAEEKNIPVLQPDKLKNPEVEKLLADFNPDLIVIIAYGKILPQKILDIPKFGCINVHASLLPKYRGAAPIEKCLIDGEKKSGVTIMQMDAGLDTGDILLSGEIPIGENMILPELREKIMTLGSELLLKVLEQIERGELNPVKQDDSLSSYAPMLTKETGRIDWKKSGGEIHNLVRGLYGGAYSFADGKKFKIWRTKISDENFSLTPGEIKITGKKFFVGTGSGVLEILEIQAPGAKKLDAKIFLAGNKISVAKFSGEQI